MPHPACLLLVVAHALLAADPVLQPGSSTVTAGAITVERPRRQENLGLQVVVRGTVDPGLVLCGRSRAECSLAVTDAGEDILQPQVVMPRRYEPTQGLRAPDPSSMCVSALHLKCPTRPAKTISLSGAVVLICETKRAEAVECIIGDPAGAQVLGKRVAAPGEQKPGSCQLVYDGDLERRIRRFEFIDADGQVVETRSSNGTGDGTKMTKTFRFAQEGAIATKVRVIPVSEEAEVRVPFAFTDLPIPALPAQDQARAPAPSSPAPSDF